MNSRAAVGGLDGALARGLSGGQQFAPGPVGRQVGRAPQERRRRGHAATGVRPARGPLQLRRHLLIGSRRRRGQMPRPPVRVPAGIGHLRQHPVRRPPLLKRR
jgi:hypothetical protein